MNTTSPITISRKTLESLKFGAVKHTSQTELEHSIDIESHLDHITGDLVSQLRARVMAEKIDAHTKTLSFYFAFEIPATWWDDFKDRRMPAWFTQRFPVRYRTVKYRRRRTVSFKKYAKYPNFPPVPKSYEFWPVYESMLEPGWTPEDQ